MSFTIITKDNERTFSDKELVNISSKEGYDCKINFGFDYLITIQYDLSSGECTILNQFNCTNLLFKNAPLPVKLKVDKFCKITTKNPDDFIIIRVNETTSSIKLESENLSEEDVKDLYGQDVNASAKLKIEKRKAEIENARVAIIKQIHFKLSDLRHKISMNSKSGVLIHIALYAASLILSFGLSNYLTGLQLKDAGAVIQMPVNLKILFLYSVIVYAIGLILKQGTYLFLQNRQNENTNNSKLAEISMIALSATFYCFIYIINLLYYMSANSMTLFAIFMSLFFTFSAVTAAMACGYFKNNNVQFRTELSKYEYREDLEHVIKEYQLWIDRYVNNLGSVKTEKIKDQLFILQMKGLGETILGILTAPVLAYGVSNTLAMCFPEAAGWVRISGLRFSPVFLTLASFMIIFAFFAFVNAFLCGKKIQASNVLKDDGFSDFIQHGVEIFGLQGIKKLDTEMQRSFIIGICIIFIEFTMNISYFMQEIGGDLRGMLLSTLAALVPTALLIAETFILSQTKFETHACSCVIGKIDRVQ